MKKNDNYCLLKQNRLLSSLWKGSLKSLRANNIPRTFLSRELFSWFNAPLGAKRFPSYTLLNASRWALHIVYLVFFCSQQENNHFSSLLHLTFWHWRALAWNHDFPMKSTHKNIRNQANIKDLSSEMSGVAQDIWLVLCCFVTEFVEPRVVFENCFLFDILLFRRFFYVCLHQRYSFRSKRCPPDTFVIILEASKEKVS